MSKNCSGTGESNREIDLVEAAEWLGRLGERNVSRDTHSQWLEWIEADPEHGRAFDDIANFSNRLEHLRSQFLDMPLPSSRKIRADDYDPSGPVSDWINRKHTEGTRRPGWSYFMAAALATVAVGLVFFNENPAGSRIGNSQPHGYETAASQHDEAILEDGSIIDIGAESALTVSFSREQRTVVLEKGEALFTVAKDADRPFVVVAGSGTITAIGTEFNVRRDSDRVVVTVAEGSVQVSKQGGGTTDETSGRVTEFDGTTQHPATLGAGEQVVYSTMGLSDVSNADPGFATSWRDGRLQYLREPLRFVVSGVNRYTDVKIVIADPEVEDMLFTGTVFDGQSREWLESLASVLSVQVEYVGNNTVLLKKNTTP